MKGNKDKKIKARSFLFFHERAFSEFPKVSLYNLSFY